MAAPNAPANLLSRNVGNGSLELQWDASIGAVSYNVYLSIAADGTFNKANLAPITDTKTVLRNIRFGLTVYIKVTAVNAADEESVQSDMAEDAVCSPGVVTLQFEGVTGDQIPAGAVFAAKVNEKLVAFITTTAGVCE
jgi:hypothetical protein